MFDSKKWQREAWNLDRHLAGYILARLLHFKNFCDRNGYPGDFYDEVSDVSYEDEWLETLDEMIWSFWYIHSEGHFEWQSIYVENEYVTYHSIQMEKIDWDKLKTLEHRCQRGLSLFAKYFRSLWD